MKERLTQERILIVGAAIAILAICIYFFAHFTSLFVAGYSPVDRIFAIILLAAESFFLIQGIGYALNVIKAHRSYRKDFDAQHFFLPTEEPKVAVCIAAFNETADTLESTLSACTLMNYGNKKVYLLDDSSRVELADDAQMLAEKYGAQYVHRTNRRGFKAGALNDVLAQLDAKYLVLLDADQRPRHDFLSEIIPLLDADPRLAFIQTPQHYDNRTSSRIANPAGSQQDVFYTNISEGKSASNVMFACGTNVVLRLATLQAVGGFDEGSVTEDFATSIKLHSQGYRSYYYHDIFVKGEGPTSIAAYYKQQMRWAYGTTRALGQLLKLFFTHPRRLSVGQWWGYFLSGTWYFVGWAFFLLMLCPIAFLIFDVHPLMLHDAFAYFAFLIPYLIFSTFVFMVSMSLRDYPIKHILLGIIMNNLAFPVYMLAVLYAIIGKEIPFVVTPKTNAYQASLKYYWPHIVMIIILAFAVVFGIYVRIGQLTLPLAMNVVWSLYAIGVLCCFVYLLKETGELSINDVDAFEQFVEANPRRTPLFVVGSTKRPATSMTSIRMWWAKSRNTMTKTSNVTADS